MESYNNDKEKKGLLTN